MKVSDFVGMKVMNRAKKWEKLKISFFLKESVVGQIFSNRPTLIKKYFFKED